MLLCSVFFRNNHLFCHGSLRRLRAPKADKSAILKLADAAMTDNCRKDRKHVLACVILAGRRELIEILERNSLSRINRSPSAGTGSSKSLYCGVSPNFSIIKWLVLTFLVALVQKGQHAA
jgi:hypothetical protein